MSEQMADPVDVPVKMTPTGLATKVLKSLLGAASVKEIIDATVDTVRTGNAVSRKGLVKCLRCDVEYRSREAQDCPHEEGHDFIQGELDAAYELGYAKPVEYVTLKVSDLFEALGVE